MKKKKSASILRKFLVFNFLVFTILGVFTFLYLKAIQPNLVKDRTANHNIIIQNTIDHLERLNVEFDDENIKTFLLSTRFLFQSLDRVQFYTNKGVLIGDTNILDLDQSVFRKSDIIIEESLGSDNQNKKFIEEKKFIENNDLIKTTIQNSSGQDLIVLENLSKNSFFLSTLSKVKIKNEDKGFIVITEEANDILLAVKERKNFILRTVLAIALVIIIFSLFLNKYILKPIRLLVNFTEAIKKKIK